jgi:hypothetical protein
MPERLSDTPAEADKVLVDMLRQAPVWRKLQMMSQLNDMARNLAMSGLHGLYPDASERELRRLLADRFLGAELAAKVYGPRPKVGDASDAV